MTNKSAAQITTGKVRFSYANLFRAKSVNGGKEKYSTTILIPKSDTETRRRIDAAIEHAVQEGLAKRFNGQRPNILALPIHDGDGVRPSDGEPYGPECRGCWVMTASSEMAPEIVDSYKNHILNESEIYSGMYGRVSVRFFAYNSNGKKGIGCGLGNVQKLEDGTPLSGRTTANDDFDDEYAPPSYAQQYQAPKVNPITGEVMY